MLFVILTFSVDFVIASEMSSHLNVSLAAFHSHKKDYIGKILKRTSLSGKNHGELVGKESYYQESNEESKNCQGPSKRLNL